jgi:hypothetical protein
MENNVVIKENGDITDVTIKPFGVTVRFDNNKMNIVFDNDCDKCINIKGNTQMLVDGDFHLMSSGEMGIASYNENVCIDSINNNIYLNSKMSKPLKHLKNDIIEIEEEYDKYYEEEKELCEPLKTLIERVEYLEEKIAKRSN